MKQIPKVYLTLFFLSSGTGGYGACSPAFIVVVAPGLAQCQLFASVSVNAVLLSPVVLASYPGSVPDRSSNGLPHPAFNHSFKTGIVFWKKSDEYWRMVLLFCFKANFCHPENLPLGPVRIVIPYRQAAAPPGLINCFGS